eukprot:7091482-Pyramimonas_sp.AAC.1
MARTLSPPSPAGHSQFADRRKEMRAQMPNHCVPSPSIAFHRGAMDCDGTRWIGICAHPDQRTCCEHNNHKGSGPIFSIPEHPNNSQNG